MMKEPTISYHCPLCHCEMSPAVYPLTTAGPACPVHGILLQTITTYGSTVLADVRREIEEEHSQYGYIDNTGLREAEDWSFLGSKVPGSEGVAA
jgi:hypothetical protein